MSNVKRYEMEVFGCDVAMMLIAHHIKEAIGPKIEGPEEVGG